MEDHQIMDVAEIQVEIDSVIRLIERLNKRKAQHDRLRRALLRTEPPEPPRRCAERSEDWWLKNAQRLVDDIRKMLDALYPQIQAYWSDKWSWDSFCMMLTDGKDNYEKWKASGWSDIHIQELQAVRRVLAGVDQKSNGQVRPSEMQAGDTPQVEAMDRTAKTESKPLFGDTWNVHGISIHWRNVRPWFRGLSRWKKLVAVVAGVLVLAFLTRSVWLPLVHHYVGKGTIEEQQSDPGLTKPSLGPWKNNQRETRSSPVADPIGKEGPEAKKDKTEAGGDVNIVVTPGTSGVCP